MTYQVLARKWRPANFNQVAGQEHVLKSLISALDNERLHHAYLFTGTRGVGKTTLARILAKCLNCEQGISSNPCEQCSACTEINQGRFIDLIEVDAASRTKVEDTRELLENVQYTPSRGRFKIYLIDEVHMLSNHSFNALLKTLEEPPPHVKFLFATTDPQKLPITILSRCLQFNLKNLSPETIVQYLQDVLESEEIRFDKGALWQIAAAAAGSMRDALTLVDQAIAYCQGEIEAAGVVEMLGVPEQQQVYALLDAMAGGEVARVIDLVKLMAEQTPDYAHTLDSLLSALHRIAVVQILPGAVDNSFGDREQLLELAGNFTAEDIQLFYQIGVKGRDDLRLATDLRAAFEMLLLRMLVFSPDYRLLDHGDEPAAPEQGEGRNKEPPAGSDVPAQPLTQAETQKKKPEPATEIAPAAEDGSQGGQEGEEQIEEQDEAIEASEPALEPARASEPAPVSEPATPTALPQSAHSQSAHAAANESAEPEPVAPETPGSRSQTGPVLAELDHDGWLQHFHRLPLSGIAANVLANTELQQCDAGRMSLILDESQSAVFNEDLIPKLGKALSDCFGETVELSVSVAATNRETPAQLRTRQRAQEREAMIKAFEQDDNVKALVEQFAGTVARDSIVPIDEGGQH